MSSGWNLDEYDELNDVLNDIYVTRYEIENCGRGCYTNCNTYSELADFIENLGERLSYCAHYLRIKKDEPEDDDE